MIKFIISDVDGTLTPNGSPDLDLEVFDIIPRFREKGMQFVVANGRSWASIENVFEPVKKKIFYVANSGTYVGCHGRCLYAYTMECGLAHHIIRRVRIYPELEMVYVGVNGDYLDSKNDTLCDWLANGYKSNVIRVKDMLGLEGPCVKIPIYKEGGIKAAARDVYDEFRDQAKMVYAGDMWMDCMTRDVNKGEVVCIIRESPGIKMEETMAFGDQLSDIETLNQTHCNLAVANVREEVRKAARLQADGSVRGRVLKILKGLL